MQAPHPQNLHQLAKCISQRLVKTLDDVNKLVHDVHFLLDAIEDNQQSELDNFSTDANSTSNYQGQKPNKDQRDLIAYLLQQQSVLMMVEEIRKNLSEQIAEIGNFNEIEVSQEALHLTLFVDYLRDLVEGRERF